MRFMNPFDRLLWWRRRATDSAPAGPTVLLNANYLTDTILNDVSAPAGNLDALSSWATATGGTFTKALAVAAGASVVDGPFYVTASGVHTGGVNAALTAATPVTIPGLATDWDIWVYCVVPASGDFYPFGKSNGGSGSYVNIQVGNGPTMLDDNGDGASDGGVITAGTKLIRMACVSGVLRNAWTGEADHEATNEGYAASLTIDTLLARGGGGVLAAFSATGAYLKAARIVTYPSGYADRASYRSTVETEIAGAALT